MTYFARLTALTGLIAVALVAAGCGTAIDDAATEDVIEQNLENSVGQKVSSVECPSGVEVEPKATFDCEVTLADGKSETVTLKILNEDADIEIAELQPDESDGESAK